MLKDLQLKAEALNALKLPIIVKAGFLGSIRLKVSRRWYTMKYRQSPLLKHPSHVVQTVGRLHVVSCCNFMWSHEPQQILMRVSLLQVPWNRLGKEPVVVLLDRIFILAEPLVEAYSGGDDDEEKKRDAKRRRVEVCISSQLQMLILIARDGTYSSSGENQANMFCRNWLVLVAFSR